MPARFFSGLLLLALVTTQAKAQYGSGVAGAVARPQEANKLFGLGVGAVLPLGDFGKGFKPGILVGGQLAMPIKNSLGIRLNLDYTRHRDKDYGWPTSSYGAILNVTHSASNNGATSAPVLLGGAGMHRSGPANFFAVNVGAGYNFRGAFVEVRYLHQKALTEFESSRSSVPIVFGLRF